MILEFSRQILEKYSQNFMKIRPERTEFLHSDGRTDIPKVTVAFRNFSIASKEENFLRCKRLGR